MIFIYWSEAIIAKYHSHLHEAPAPWYNTGVTCDVLRNCALLKRLVAHQDFGLMPCHGF